MARNTTQNIDAGNIDIFKNVISKLHNNRIEVIVNNYSTEDVDYVKNEINKLGYFFIKEENSKLIFSVN